MLNVVSNFKAGRLQTYASAWPEITRDYSILKTIKYGIEIELEDLPDQLYTPRQYNFSNCEHEAIVCEIQSLLNKGVIKQVCHCEGEFISNIFVRPKKDGNYRMILNLSDLNLSVSYHHFKMSTFNSAIDLITPNCYMATLDWKDAYYCVAIHDKHKKLLRFTFDGVLYEFQVLPNGLSSGPRIFTKLTKPFFSQLRKLGYMNSPYIDDCLLVAQSKDECIENVKATIKLSCDTGFVVHPIKSIFDPVQVIEYLGFVIDSVNMRVSVNDRQKQKIISACRMGIESDKISILDLSKIVGLLVASFPGVEYGPLFYRRLDNAKTLALKLNKGNYKAFTTLSNTLKQDLQWWIDNIPTAFKPISHGNSEITISSDASLIGWGASCNGNRTGGNWTQNEANTHISTLELRAVYFALRCFAKDLANVHIKLLIDNTTALAYVDNMGGKVHELNEIARELWLWCKERGIWLTPAYITSADNVEADEESMKSHDNLEWKLNRNLFNKICKFFGTPEVDLFASRLNNQIKNYIAWKPDPFALAVDAFTMDWSKLGIIYAFPPFVMISKMLKKITLDKVEKAIIVVPFWTTQPWFSRLSKMLTTCPFLLPRKGDTLQHPVVNRKHDLEAKLQLMVCTVSGNISKPMEFLNVHRRYCCCHGNRGLRSSTTATLNDGFAFVVNRVLISCHQM